MNRQMKAELVESAIAANRQHEARQEILNNDYAAEIEFDKAMWDSPEFQHGLAVADAEWSER